MIPLRCILAPTLFVIGGVVACSRAPDIAAATSEADFTVQGMTCNACENTISSQVRSIAGVESCAASFASGRVHVVYAPNLTDEAHIADAIRAIGFEVPENTMKNAKPKDCPALLASGYTYLDVRTTEEFEAAHPTGAFNVPVMTRGAGGMQPNPDFTRVVAAKFGKDAKLVVGCQSGMRSQRACQELAAAGFKDLVNMECGFGGARDPSGNVEPGWQACGLPTESGKSPGRTYAELQAAAQAR